VATRVRSYSKINLGLAVGPARPDGFHGLTTVYQTLALHDVVTVSAKFDSTTTLRLTSDHPGVPSSEHGNGEKNTAWKMVESALKQLGINANVKIHIEKLLPVQGGMGAGSANAVAALIGLEKELGIALPGTERLKLAASVGSDVPLFLLGGTVLGLGRGEEVYPLPDSSPVSCVVAVPTVGVSTALAFKDLDARMAAALTSAPPVDKLKELSYALAAVWANGNQTGAEAGPSGITRADQAVKRSPAQRGDLAESPGFPSNSLDGMLNPLLALVRTGIENDFEEVAFSQHPSLRSIKRDLLGSSDSGALCAALSGSGSALFGLYESPEAAREAQQRVQKNGTRAILTETLPRRDYWNAMFD
jgi:4-diphosphocytidyl-2-C-methyl-D-erythritol kinase